MPSHPRALLSLVACLLVGCTAAGSVAPPKATGGRGAARPVAPKASLPPAGGPEAGPLPSGASPPPARVAPQAPRGALVGRVQLPASLLSNNGGRVVSNIGGGLVSDQGGSILSNNGATLISDRGGSVVSNNGAGVVSNGGGRYALRQALATGPGADVVAIANAQVGLFDARGEAVRDASGAPLVTTTDAEGRYAFPTAPTDRALVAVCQLAGTAGQAAALVLRARGQADLDVASSVMASYVISKFARPQADPQAALERLPGELEAEARAATAVALAQGSAPARLEATAAIEAVEALRQGEAGVDDLYEAVRRAMVVAGLSNFGEGQPVASVTMSLSAAHRASTGRWWLLDRFNARLWEVVEGRLQVLAGSGLWSSGPVPSGTRASEVALDGVVALHEGPEGAPWVLTQNLLGRVEGDGRLTVLWTRPAAERLGGGGKHWWVVDVLPVSRDQAYLVGSDRVLALGGLPARPFPDDAGGGIVAADLRPDGRLRVVTRALTAGFRLASRVRELPPGGPATAGPELADRLCHGFDDAGHLVTGDGAGTLRFSPPDGGAPIIVGPDVTARWPSELRRGLGSLWLRFGGDIRTGGWVWQDSALGAYGRSAVLGTYGPDGLAVLAFAVQNDVWNAPGSEGRALVAPGSLAMGPDDTLYVVNDGSLYRVVERRGEPVAGGVTPTGRASFVPTPGDPFACTLEVLAKDGTVVAVVPGLGAGYQAPLAEALLFDPVALRVAEDGALWVLEQFTEQWSAVRKVVGGQLQTVAIQRSNDPLEWLDVFPAGDGAAVVLARAETYLALLRVSGTEPPVELVRLADPDPPEACDLCQDDGAVALPGGQWLLRVQGVLWRWAPGLPPVRIGVDGIETFDAVARATMMVSHGGKVAIADTTRVYRIDLATGQATPVVGRDTANLAGTTVDTSLMSVSGLAVAPNGDLLVSDEEAGQVKRVPAAAW
ncbi:MAG: hypothetical protein VKS61_00735 [Candidatus Sericytochromatia bacterium]|nr:hypothetical protein [Candidatus Sericytochromatia bacterium]